MNSSESGILLRVSVAHWVSHIHLMTVPALLPLLPKYLNVSFLELGLAMSVLMVVTTILQAPMGFIVDRFGASRVLSLALLLGGVSFGSMIVFPHYIWLILVMVFIGVANTVYHPADYAILAVGIDQKRMGRAFSVHTFSGFIGTAMTPAMLLPVAYSFGVEWAFAISAATAFLALAVLNSGQLGKLKKKSKEPVRIDTLSIPIVPSKAAEPAVKVKATSVLSNPSVIGLTILFAFLTLSTVPIQDFGVTVLDLGYAVDPTSGNIAVSSFLFSSSFGVLIGGWLADKTKQHGLVAAGAFAITALLSTILAGIELPFPVLVTLLAVIGLLMGVIMPSRDMMVRAIAPAGAEGRVFGVVSTGFSIGGAIAPVIFGWFLDHDLPRVVFWLAPVFMLVVAIISVFQELASRKAAKAKASAAAAS